MIKQIISVIRSYALYGNNVTCCICNKNFITFLPAGDEIKAHTSCPSCHSIDRSRQLWLLLQQLITNSNNPLNILHIAPERPLFAQLKKIKNINYYPIDNFEKGYKYSVAVKQGNLTALDFSDNMFDIFICSHVLEHIVDDKKAMLELFRILKHQGVGFIIVPYFQDLIKTYEDFSVTTSEERKLKFGQADHVRKYGADFKQKLESAGFNVEEDRTHQAMEYQVKVKLGLINAEVIFKVTKSISIK